MSGPFRFHGFVCSCSACLDARTRTGLTRPAAVKAPPAPPAAPAAPVVAYSEILRSALNLGAELLTAIQTAHDVLAPIAETDPAAAIAFQTLADALASARPPAPTA